MKLITIFLTLATATLANQPLDYAFRFATALGSHDATDAGRAQGRVIVDLLNLNQLDAAIALADQVVDWRQGVAYADIATALARAGRTNETAAFIAKAEAVRQTTTGERGFEKGRIAAHIAIAHLSTGTNDEAVAELLADLPLEERVKLPPRRIAQTADADFDQVLDALKTMPSKNHIDIATGLAEGYLALLDSPAVGTNAARRTAVVAGLRELTAKQPLAVRAPYLERAAGNLITAGQPAAAREILTELESSVRRLVNYDEPLPGKPKKYRAAVPGGDVLAPILARVAIGFHRLGDTGHALELLTEAEALPSRTADVVDALRPRLEVAQAYATLQRSDDAWKRYAGAFDEAAHFANARPRALAMAELCRSLGRQKLTLDDAWRARLDASLAGLKDPW